MCVFDRFVLARIDLFGCIEIIFTSSSNRTAEEEVYSLIEGLGEDLCKITLKTKSIFFILPDFLASSPEKNYVRFLFKFFVKHARNEPVLKFWRKSYFLLYQLLKFVPSTIFVVWLCNTAHLKEKHLYFSFFKIIELFKKGKRFP